MSRSANILPPEAAKRFTQLVSLGKGGQGEVYRAFDGEVGRVVALKVIRPDLAGNPEHASRFRREVRALARLDHPNVVRIFDAFEEEGIRLFVMEVVEGKSLRDLLQSGPLAPPKACDLAAAVAEGLAAAHEAGVVHRDVKPLNVIIAPDGPSKLIDFGVAAFVDKATITALTRTGQKLGTFHYMPPEVFEGKSSGTAGDVYQAGLLLHEALTGANPLRDVAIDDLLRGEVFSAIAPPSTTEAAVPEALDTIVMACLTPDPAKRPSARQLADRLQAWLRPSAEADDPGETRVTSPVQLRPSSMAGKKWLLIAIALLLATLLLAFWFHCRLGAPPWVGSIEVHPRTQSARIRWSTDRPLRCSYILRSQKDGEVLRRGHDPQPTCDHRLSLRGLVPGRLHHLRIEGEGHVLRHAFVTPRPRIEDGVFACAYRDWLYLSFTTNVDRDLTVEVRSDSGVRRKTVAGGKGPILIPCPTPPPVNRFYDWSVKSGETIVASGKTSIEPVSVDTPRYPKVMGDRRKIKARHDPILMGDDLYFMTGTHLLTACRVERSIWAGGKTSPVSVRWAFPFLTARQFRRGGTASGVVALSDGRLVAIVHRRRVGTTFWCFDPPSRARTWEERCRAQASSSKNLLRREEKVKAGESKTHPLLPSWARDPESSWHRPLGHREYRAFFPELGHLYPQASPVIHDNLIFSSFVNARGGFGVLCFDPRSKRVLWHRAVTRSAAEATTLMKGHDEAGLSTKELEKKLDTRCALVVKGRLYMLIELGKKRVSPLDATLYHVASCAIGDRPPPDGLHPSFRFYSQIRSPSLAPHPDGSSVWIVAGERMFTLSPGTRPPLETPIRREEDGKRRRYLGHAPTGRKSGGAFVAFKAAPLPIHNMTPVFHRGEAFFFTYDMRKGGIAKARAYGPSLFIDDEDTLPTLAGFSRSGPYYGGCSPHAMFAIDERSWRFGVYKSSIFSQLKAWAVTKDQIALVVSNETSVYAIPLTLLVRVGNKRLRPVRR